MLFKQIVDPKLAHYAYLIGCQESGQAVIVDPQRDIDRYIGIADSFGLRITAAADTHIHADYLTGLREFAELPGVTVYASDEGDADWKYNWLIGSGYQYRLLKNGDTFGVGSAQLRAWHTPGHTPEHLAFLVTDLSHGTEASVGIISGDFVFVGDVGRPDLLEKAAKHVGTMEQSARTLYASLQKFKVLAPSLMLWPGHGAGSSCGKALSSLPSSTVGDELATNPSLRAAADSDTFVDYILADQPEPPAYFSRMKEWNREGPPVLGGLPQPDKLAASDLAHAVTSGKYVFVDTRAWSEYARGHIPGALHVPLVNDLPTLIGSFVEADEQVCLIIEEDGLDAAIRDCIRVGVDHIECFVVPSEIEAYFRAGGQSIVSNEVAIDALPDYFDGSRAILLDVRRAAELAETGHIAGSYNIAHPQLQLRYNELPRDREIVVYCRTGNRSRYAYGFLEHMGFRVTLADGGVARWAELGRPMVHDPSTVH